MDLFSTNRVQGALQDRGSSQASFGNAAVQLGESEDTRAEEGMEMGCTELKGPRLPSSSDPKSGDPAASAGFLFLGRMTAAAFHCCVQEQLAGLASSYLH